jgi:hypothetical protein
MPTPREGDLLLVTRAIDGKTVYSVCDALTGDALATGLEMPEALKYAHRVAADNRVRIWQEPLDDRGRQMGKRLLIYRPPLGV